MGDRSRPSRQQTHPRPPVGFSDAARAFGARLRKVRIARGIRSMSELARMLEVDTETVRLWEMGRSYPRPPHIAELRRILGVTSDYLLFGDTAGMSAEVLADLSPPSRRRKVET